jgi:uncharacterized phage protein (TIGR01671 family)
MQDRFKFRVWDKDQKIMKECTQITLDKDQKGSMGDIKGKVTAHLIYQPHYILMQCTGLKDKNGKLIYEGDIMNVLIDSLKPHYIKQVVVWDRKEWQLKTYNKDYRKNCSECGRQLRTKCKCCSEYFSSTGHTNFKEFYNGITIGNIYENPELLEECEDE